MLSGVEANVLRPDVISYIAEEAQRLVQVELANRGDAGAGRERLEAIANELANLIRLAAKTGRVDEVARTVSELKRERAEIERGLGSLPGRRSTSTRFDARSTS